MLKISNLNVHYGESHIIRNVDLTVLPGQMVCLIGRNGVGKTTMLKTIMGLLKPSSGIINFAGEIINPKPTYERAKMGIGYVSQGREIIPRLTVKENLLLGLEARQKLVKKPEIPSEIFSLFPVLKTMLSRMGGDLSGGQQRRLALAVQLIRQPNVLLLDEPTAGLDWSMRRQLVNLLAKLKKDWTLLVVTHDAGDMLPIADYCWTLDHGVLRSGVREKS